MTDLRDKIIRLICDYEPDRGEYIGDLADRILAIPAIANALAMAADRSKEGNA